MHKLDFKATETTTDVDPIKLYARESYLHSSRYQRISTSGLSPLLASIIVLLASRIPLSCYINLKLLSALYNFTGEKNMIDCIRLDFYLIKIKHFQILYFIQHLHNTSCNQACSQNTCQYILQKHNTKTLLKSIKAKLSWNNTFRDFGICRQIGFIVEKYVFNVLLLN